MLYKIEFHNLKLLLNNMNSDKEKKEITRN